MRKPDLACPALLLLLAGPVSAQHVDTGFLDRTVTVAGHSYRYQVYVPADYLTKATWPVILFLHGGGERYTEYLGLNHNSWDATYASDEFLRWLFAQRRRKS